MGSDARTVIQEPNDDRIAFSSRGQPGLRIEIHNSPPCRLKNSRLVCSGERNNRD
jgi:hypothetical protein